MSKFTPGPWEVGQYPWLIQEQEKDGVDGEVSQASSHRAEFEANARLIAAAPELLAACEMLAKMHALDRSDPTEIIRPIVVLGSEQLRQLEAAIAKAKGGEA